MSVHPAMRAKRHWTEMKRTWMAIWLLDLILWLSLPVRYGDSKFSLQLSEEGTPGKIIVTVHDLQKNPVSGVKVRSSGDSGGAPEAFTDPSGLAIISPAEYKVTTIWIDERGFDFENLFLSWYLQRLPSCKNGLTIRATLKSR
jgi:hypothetical protein